MKLAIDETERRRNKQIAFNTLHGIIPRSIKKSVRDMIDGVYSEKSGRDDQKLLAATGGALEELSERDLSKRITLLEKQMLEHARNLEFEKAARVRDQLAQLRERAFGGSSHDNIVSISAARSGR